MRARAWFTGWKISLWARMGEGDHALALIRQTLRLEPGGVYANLFGSHPPFQMDGNFAFPAGIAEMLLQSHAAEGEIHLLPAHAQGLADGVGERAASAGGFEVDIDWKNGITSPSRSSDRSSAATPWFATVTGLSRSTAIGGRHALDGRLNPTDAPDK